VKIIDGFFLVGLSNVDADCQRNAQLLKERSWFRGSTPISAAPSWRSRRERQANALYNAAFAAWGE
jgi:hypothetical protein